MKKYVDARGWTAKYEITEVGSGAKTNPKRKELIDEARRRNIDVIIIWKLDRWRRSVHDLFQTLSELTNLGIGFISLTEALNMTTPTGRAMAGLLSVFSEFERKILKERVRAGIAHARSKGRNHGRPPTASLLSDNINVLYKQGMSKSEIARKLKIGRTSVRRVLSD